MTKERVDRMEQKIDSLALEMEQLNKQASELIERYNIPNAPYDWADTFNKLDEILKLNEKALA